MKTHVRITAVLLLTCSILLLQACAWLDKLTHFTIKQSKTFTIPAGIPANIPYMITTPYFATNSKQYFDEHNTDEDLLESAKVSQLTATLLQAGPEDFSFISSMHIYLLDRRQRFVEVAYLDPVPDPAGDTLRFQLPDVELKDYIREDSLAFRVQIYTRRANTAALAVRVEAHFLIDAKILGI